MTSKPDDDVQVSDPPHRSVCRYCCPVHDELRAENERLTQGWRQEIHAKALLAAENERLRETIAEWQEIHGTFTGDVHRACQTEIERLRAVVDAFRHHHTDPEQKVTNYLAVARALEALDRDKCRNADQMS